ncbi:pupal cuticle protein C1B-like [Leptopilina heterotoma]|uniref:pupal cuticle protein C1B-like n=1 Tax=Leptopilina heterotoma TaxID=63436 RepID=UPI001CA9405D|nr:pupal cuticle protein C1B-like [Leptopilina heterotoma]
MFSKITIVACLLAAVNAGFVQYQPAALTSTQDNILRSPGNLAQISTQSKTIQTPFSSSSKSDIRVSNPGYVAHTYAAAPIAQTYAAAPVAHTYAAAPIAQTYAAAPVAHTYAAAPVAHAAPASLLGVAYSPAVAVSHMSYSSPIGVYSW